MLSPSQQVQFALAPRRTCLAETVLLVQTRRVLMYRGVTTSASSACACASSAHRDSYVNVVLEHLEALRH